MRIDAPGAGIIFTFLLAALLVACPNPYDDADDLDRDLDRRPADVSGINATAVDPYDTRPEWTWEGDPEEGTGIFRYRINGGAWTVVVDQTRFSPGDTGEHFYPGTYRFEVQERNQAGTWSTAAAQSTITILVREPIFVASSVPPDPTNDTTPAFAWDQWRSTENEPQYGALARFAFRLDYRVEDPDAAATDEETWVPVEGHIAAEEPVFGYTVGSATTDGGPLTDDGRYRFAVAEWNEGGQRSTYVYHEFELDTVAPDAPVITGPSVVSDADESLTVFSVAPDEGDSFHAFLWELVDSGTTVAAGESSVSEISVALSSSVPGPAGPGPGLGAYTFRVAQRDLAGNIGAYAEHSVSVEAIPSITYLGPNPTNLTPGSEPEFEILGIEIAGVLLDQYRWVIDGTDMSGTFGSGYNFTATVPIGGYSDGTYDVAVRQAREDGGWTAISNEVSLTIDRVPPDPPVITTGPADGALLNIGDGTTVTYTITFEPGAVINYELAGPTPHFGTQTDAGSNGNETLEFGPLDGDGDLYTLELTAEDAAGNISNPIVRTFTLDVVAPAMPGVISGPEDEAVLDESYGDIVEFELNFEPGAELQYTLSGPSPASGTLPDVGADGTEILTLGPLDYGPYTLEVIAVDPAGNPSDPLVRTFERISGEISTITIENPTVPTFTIDNGGVVLDRSVPESWNLSVSPGAGVTIDAYQWLVNAVEESVGATFTLGSNSPNTNLGMNNLTLFVQIGGVWYSESFFFEVVEN